MSSARPRAFRFGRSGRGSDTKISLNSLSGIDRGIRDGTNSRSGTSATHGCSGAFGVPIAALRRRPTASGTGIGAADLAVETFGEIRVRADRLASAWRLAPGLAMPHFCLARAVTEQGPWTRSCTRQRLGWGPLRGLANANAALAGASRSVHHSHGCESPQLHDRRQLCSGPVQRMAWYPSDEFPDVMPGLAGGDLPRWSGEARTNVLLFRAFQNNLRAMRHLSFLWHSAKVTLYEWGGGFTRPLNPRSTR